MARAVMMLAMIVATATACSNDEWHATSVDACQLVSPGTYSFETRLGDPQLATKCPKGPNTIVG